MRKVLTIIAGLAFAATTSFVISNVAAATAPDPNHKSWVCKYVGKPGVDERFSHLIWVDVAATEGSWFKDGQNNSYVLKADAPREPKPDASLCPGNGPSDGPTDTPTDTPTDEPTIPSPTPDPVPVPPAGPTVNQPPTVVTPPQVTAPQPAAPKHAHVPSVLPNTGA